MHRAKDGGTLADRCKILPKRRPLLVRQLGHQRVCSPSFFGALSGSENTALLVDAAVFIDAGVDLVWHLGDVQDKMPVPAELFDLALRQGPDGHSPCRGAAAAGDVTGGW
jgi:hypothetical protein